MKIDIEKTSGIFEVNIRKDSSENVDRDKCYEFAMISNNDIPVFLDYNIRNENGEEFYSYSIPSMISLKDYAERAPLKYEELTGLITSLSECRKAVRGYLLSPEGVVIEPEYVFYDKNKKIIRFCFYPWNTSDTYSSYTKLAEFLLLVVDYDDEKAVKLAYEIYASVLNKDYELEKYVEYKIMKPVEVNKEDIDDEANKERKYEYVNEAETQNSRKAKTHKNDFSKFSILCMALLIVMGILFAVTYNIDKNLIMKYLSNVKIMTMVILFVSFLIYFPLMNLVDIKCYLVTNKQL